jgi:hypothetical protein
MAKLLVNAVVGSWATILGSFLGLEEYNAAHEPTNIYWECCCGYTFGFALDVSGHRGYRVYWGYWA